MNELERNHWKIALHLREKDDLDTCGKRYLRKFIQEERIRELNLRKDIEKIEKRIKRMRDEDFPRGIEKYKPKTLPVTSLTRVLYDGRREIVIQPTETPKAGSTTFTVCGYCKYFNANNCRYHEDADVHLNHLYENSHCVFHGKEQEYFEMIIGGMTKTLNYKRIYLKNDVIKEVERLLEIERATLSYPPPFELRKPDEFFAVNDTVYAFISGINLSGKSTRWEKAIITRVEETAFRFIFVNKIKDNIFEEEAESKFNSSDSWQVLYEDEIRAFQENPSYAVKWFEQARLDFQQAKAMCESIVSHKF